MIEILAGDGIENAFLGLGINAFKCYSHPMINISVWQIDDEGLDKLNRFPDKLWKKDWGWYRYAKQSVQSHYVEFITINHNPILAWIKNYDDISEYDSLTSYFWQVWGYDDITKITELSVDLAALNEMTLAQLFTFYQGDDVF